jgi:Tol biopolymer transport system component/tRNA A-37 threonylcarbamoyl transferase component Bud32
MAPLSDSDGWTRLDALLDAALERPEDERARFLDEACKDDPQRRIRIEELLRLAEEPDARLQPGGGLRGPVWEELAEEIEAEAQAPFAQGETLGRYVIRGLLGTGGMGRVYRAHDSTLDREVAIKAVTRDFRDDAASLRRFEREARLLATLNHPNIAAIYGFELIEGRPYLVLELVEGRTLRERLEDGPLSVPEALGVAVQIADALQEAHDKGIVHRDLKPANVTLGESGRVKILDFGIAKPVGVTSDGEDTPTAGANPTTLPGAVMGTAPYMSPEQARGLPVDTRSDVWAFGCLVYEMLTGARAFPGVSQSDVLAAVLRDEVDLSLLPPDTPAGMRRLLRRCLRKDPRDRLQDAGDARLELTEAAMEDPPAVPSSPGLRRLLLPFAVALAGVALVTALALRIFSKAAPTAPGVVRLSLELPAGVPLADDYAAPFALSPDGSKLAILSRRSQDHQDPRESSQLHERAMGGLAFTPVAGTNGAWQPTFAPDGRKVAFFADRMLKTVALGGGPVETLAEIGGNPRGASWGEDGTIVVSPAQSKGLVRVNARGGTPQPLTQIDEARGEVSHRWPQTLPGGRFVLFTVALEEENYDDARLEVASLETGERRVLVTGGAHGRYVSTGHIVFARGGRLLAVPFDLEALAVRGSPTVVAEGVRYDPRNGGTHMAVSASGTLVYGPGTPTSTEHGLAWMGASGEIREITDTPRAFRELRLSPDGRRIALVIGRGSDSDLWLMDLQSGTLSQLTFGLRPRRPLWTPDGRKVTIAVPSGSGWTLALVSRDGGAPITLFERKSRVYPNAWTSDGRTLLFQERRPGMGWDLLAADVDEGGQVTTTRALVESPFNEANADLSPDGRFLAYESDELDNVFEVYVRPLHGGVKVRTTTTGARWPRFGAAGQLFYWYSFEGQLRQLDYRAERDRVVAGPGRPVFGGSASAGLDRIMVRASYESYDLDVPRQRILVLARAAAPAPLLTRPTVVLNWADELQALSRP